MQSSDIVRMTSVVGAAVLGIACTVSSKLPIAVRVSAAAITVVAVIALTSRDLYLPFLAPTAFPAGAVPLGTPKGANQALVLRGLEPGSRVVFWAAEPAAASMPWAHPKLAYGDGANSGSCISDAHGTAILRVRSPGAYHVPGGRLLPPHVHYRVVTPSSRGLFGPVQTAYIQK